VKLSYEYIDVLDCIDGIVGNLDLDGIYYIDPID
jgi:hypothetical protein